MITGSAPGPTAPVSSSLISWGEITDAQFSYGQPRPTGINPASCLTWQDFINNLFFRGATSPTMNEMITKSEFNARLYVRPYIIQPSGGVDDRSALIDEYDAAGTVIAHSNSIPGGAAFVLRVATTRVAVTNGGTGEFVSLNVASGEKYQVTCTFSGLFSLTRLV